MKQAKAHLAKLDGTTSKMTGSYKKSAKKPKETAAIASQADPALQVKYVSDIKQVQEAAESQGQVRASCHGHVPALRKPAVNQRQVRVEQDHPQADSI